MPSAQGNERDWETGLDYVEARYFDPAIGMFRQVDPLWEKYLNFTPYHYGLNNPIIAIDAEGETVVLVVEGKHNGYVKKVNWGNHRSPKFTEPIWWQGKKSLEDNSFYTFEMSVYRNSASWADLDIDFDKDWWSPFKILSGWFKIASFDVARDAWYAGYEHDANDPYGKNNEAPLGWYKIVKSNGTKGGPRGWFSILGIKGKIISSKGSIRVGLAIHPGDPRYSRGCITMSLDQFLKLAAILNQAINNGESVYLLIKGRRIRYNYEKKRWEYVDDEKD